MVPIIYLLKGKYFNMFKGFLFVCLFGFFQTIHLAIRRVYHIVAYLQVGVYHIVAYHDRNFIRKWTSGICRVRKLYRI